jgi:hypothetical protein
VPDGEPPSELAGRGDGIRERVAATGDGPGVYPSRSDGPTPDASVTFESQAIDGRTVVVKRVTTEVDAEFQLEIPPSEDVSKQVRVNAGTHQNVEVELTRTFDEPTQLRVDLDDIETGREIASAVAAVFPNAETVEPGIEVTEVPADPEAGFEYPYFLYAPAAPPEARGGPVLVETNNTGTSTDDYQRHKDAARELIKGNWNGGSGRAISDQLFVPFVVPAFPRPRDEPVSFRRDIHQLDTEAMRIDSGPLERVDLQLLAMVEDARGRFRKRGYPVEDGLLLNGFSASGQFTHRFTVLHPKKVTAVTAGGVNGMPTLPIEEAKGHTLNYQIGVADVAEITGDPFDREAYAEVDQFLYLGELDGSDTIPFGDSWSDAQREIALDVYGQNMQRDRFPYSKSVYEDAGIDGTVFRIYEKVGHNPRPVIDDLVEFHQRALDGEETASLGGYVGNPSPPVATLSYSPESPTAGETVSFDATGSRAPGGELAVTTWDFDDGQTGSTPTPTHTFADAGEYTVEVRVVDGNGKSATETATVTVEGDG